MNIIAKSEFRVGTHEFTVQAVKNPSVYVEFVDGMRTPLATLARLTAGYSGNYEYFDPTVDQQNKAIEDIQNTKLKTPLEFMFNVFMIKNVTRSFTHQLVRTRMASFVQESMRFIGKKDIYSVLVPFNISDEKDAVNFAQYFESSCQSITTYEQLIENGVSSEDARDTLPHGILTSIFVGLPMSSFLRMYEQRMCCQAQPGQWQIVMKEMKRRLVINYGEEMGKLITAPYERGESCNYRASFDRPCSWEK